MGLGRFDQAKECFELLRSLGQGATAKSYLMKVQDAEKGFQMNTDQVAPLVNQVEAESVPLNQKTSSKSELETQAQETQNEAVQKTVSQPNSRTEYGKLLPNYLLIAFATLVLSIFLNWQLKNQIRY